MRSKQENLEKIIKSLESKVHSIVLEDREGQFLVENTGNFVMVEFLDGSSIEGELIDIDKNRICILVDNNEVYYYKHAVKSYYKK